MRATQVAWCNVPDRKYQKYWWHGCLSLAYDPELKEATHVTTKYVRNAHFIQSTLSVQVCNCAISRMQITLYCWKGFQTTDMLGIVMELDNSGPISGLITKLQELWNQDYFYCFTRTWIYSKIRTNSKVCSPLFGGWDRQRAHWSHAVYTMFAYDSFKFAPSL